MFKWLDRRLYWKPWWRKVRGLPEPRLCTPAEMTQRICEAMWERNALYRAMLDKRYDA